MKNPSISYTKNSITVVFSNTEKPFTVRADSPYYARALEMIKAKNWTGLRDVFDSARAVSLWSDGKLEIKERNKVFYNGIELSNSLLEKVLELFQNGFDLTPISNFIGNLLQNTLNKDIKDEIFAFLDAGNIPITDDGCFLAYKKVRPDYLSHHDVATPNRVGDKPICKDFDTNRNQECSRGLHFCAFGYLNNYHGSSESRIMVVKVNPKDVAAIPTDYKRQKGRARTYEIVAELTELANSKLLDSTKDDKLKEFKTATVENGVIKKYLPKRDANGRFCK